MPASHPSGLRHTHETIVVLASVHTNDMLLHIDMITEDECSAGRA